MEDYGLLVRCWPWGLGTLLAHGGLARCWHTRGGGELAFGSRVIVSMGLACVPTHC